jgi:ABC-2 type transport system ATP-binding protein
MSIILEVKNLVKHYPRVKAVNGVSFAIPEGICYGLLGPNGAGKTTTIEVIEGISPPTSGEVLYRGEPIGKKFREKTGIQFQSTSLPDYLTVREVLKLFGSFYRSSDDPAELIRLCALEEFLDRDTHQLSGGQRQRVLLAIALINKPDIVFLDEPTTGLDPQARRNFWELIQIIKARKTTVILTTHYMEEAYRLCDQIAIMDRGQIISQGSPDELLKKHFDGVIIEIPNDDWKSHAVPAEWKVGTAGQKQATRHQIRNGLCEITTTQVNQTLKDLIGFGIDLSRINVRSATLEDLFIELTGKQLRE